MSYTLNLIPLENALRSLEDALAQEKTEYIRDAVIKRFEFTFELSWKTIKRYLELSGLSETAPATRRDLFRIAAREGLISDPEQWFQYNAARNSTSHIYNVQMAEQVYESARQFLPDGKSLLKELSERT